MAASPTTTTTASITQTIVTKTSSLGRLNELMTFDGNYNNNNNILRASTESNLASPQSTNALNLHLQTPQWEYSVSKIYDWLYLGAEPAVEAPDNRDQDNPRCDMEKTTARLSEYKITHIINCANDCVDLTAQLKAATYPIRGYKKFPLDDSEDQELRPFFDEFINTLNEYRNSAPDAVILVHCKEGVSRSVTMVLAYLVKEKHMRRKHALRFVGRKRKLASPRRSFIEQIKSYFDELYPCERLSPAKSSGVTVVRLATIGTSPLSTQPVQAKPVEEEDANSANGVFNTLSLNETPSIKNDSLPRRQTNEFQALGDNIVDPASPIIAAPLPQPQILTSIEQQPLRGLKRLSKPPRLQINQ